MQPWYSFLILAVILTAIMVPTIVVSIKKANSSSNPVVENAIYVVARTVNNDLPQLLRSTNGIDWTVVGSYSSTVDITSAVTLGNTVYMSTADPTNNIWTASSAGVFSPLANTNYDVNGIAKIVKAPSGNFVLAWTVNPPPAPYETKIFTTTNNFASTTPATNAGAMYSLAVASSSNWSGPVIEDPINSKYTSFSTTNDAGSFWLTPMAPIPPGPGSKKFYFETWNPTTNQFLACGQDEETTNGLISTINTNGIPTSVTNNLTSENRNLKSIVFNQDSTRYVVNDNFQNVLSSNSLTGTFTQSWTNSLYDVQWIPLIQEFLMATEQGLYTSVDGTSWTKRYTFTDVGNAFIAI